MSRTPASAAGRPRTRRGWTLESRPHLTLTFALAAAISQGGCVALNVPSERYHDAEDSGGIFGPWNATGHPDAAGHRDGAAGHSQQISGHRETAEDAASCQVRPEVPERSAAPDLDANQKPAKSDVPWPRFHPVPTRPIFGSPEL